MNLASFDDDTNICTTNICTTNGGCFGYGGGDPAAMRTSVLDSAASLSTTVDDTNMKEARKLVLQNMNHLSVKEREQAYEDVHGVRQEVAEDRDERIAYALNQMEVEITKIKSKFAAYLLAEQMSSKEGTIIQNIKFRLQFLRSTCFDPILAAKRFVNFFEMKLMLFGQEKLIKKILLSDLDNDDQRCLMSGRFQLLPQRDRSGRAVMCFISRQLPPYERTESMLRAVWYFLMAVIEDEETQRTGVVGIFNFLGCNNNGNHDDRKVDPSRIELLRRAPQFYKSLPMRVSCTHFCFNGSKTMALAFMAVVVRGVESVHRTRMCFHDASDAECQFALMTYGIPIHTLPFTAKGEIMVDTHIKWIHSRRILKEGTMRNMMIVLCDGNNNNRMNCNNNNNDNNIYLPSKYDVLCERGKPYQNYTGNEQLREMITKYKERYLVKGEKQIFANLIMQQYKECFGRFLKKDKMNNDLWMEVSNVIATKKVYNMLITATTSKTR